MTKRNQNCLILSFPIPTHGFACDILTWLDGRVGVGASARLCGAAAGGGCYQPHIMEATARHLDLLHVGRCGKGDDGLKLGCSHPSHCNRLDWLYSLYIQTA